MKILFDHEIFCLQKKGGVSRYFVELFKRIPREQWDCSVFISNNDYLSGNELINSYKFLKEKNIKGLARTLDEISKINSIRRVIKSDFDIFHPTLFGTYAFPYLGKKKIVTTFHDTNFLKYNYKGFKKQKESLTRADKIICVSHNTKKEMLEAWDIPEEKIQVIYHGVEIPMNKEDLGSRLINKPYLLYVGLRVAHKNFRDFASAFSLLKKIYPHLKLVCTSVPFSKSELSFLSELKILDDTIYINASERDLANLYSYAELFVYPSFHEGFGMPILEAMSYGCPSIVSNTSCLPEIARDAAFYFNPYDIDNMANEISKLIENTSLRTSKVERGYELCKEYTWEKCAKEHLKTYESLI